MFIPKTILFACLTCIPCSTNSFSTNSIFGNNIKSRQENISFKSSAASTSRQRLSAAKSIEKTSNTKCEEYPWKFTGRLWFRPAIVKVPSTATPLLKNSIQALSIFGYTIGGVVALEYDTSPIGPYNEYVTMGALVANSNDGILNAYFGQWGENLYVSTKQAVSICDTIWGVPAQCADIRFEEEVDSDKIYVQSIPTALPENSAQKSSFGNLFSTKKVNTIQVNGWHKTRRCKEETLNTDVNNSRPSIDVYWTPTIKALWLPFNLPFFQQYKNKNQQDDSNKLPLHKLRLSASSLGIVKCNQDSNDSLGISFPFGLVVDDVSIQISPTIGHL